MTDYNVTALLEKLNVEEKIQTTSNPESLNAGFELPMDNLVTEVEVDPAAIADLIPQEELTDQEAAVLESYHTNLLYLREDMLAAGGMTQELATEAIALKPSFGKGKPVSYYSRTATGTNYKLSLEEIDNEIIVTEVNYLNRIKYQIERISSAYAEWDNTVITKCWTELLTAVPIFNVFFADAKNILVKAGINWNDSELIELTFNNIPSGLNPKVQKYIENKLNSTEGPLQEIIDGGYYTQIGQAIPNYLDMYTHLFETWDKEINSFISSMNIGTNEVTIPVVPSFTLPCNTDVNSNKLHAKLLNAATDALKYKGTNNSDPDISNRLWKISSAITNSSIPDILVRTKNIQESAKQHLETIVELISKTNDCKNLSSDDLAETIKNIHSFSKPLLQLYTDYVNFILDSNLYVINFIDEIKTLVISLTVLIETVNDKIVKSPTPAFTLQAEALDEWSKRVADIRKCVTFLC